MKRYQIKFILFLTLLPGVTRLRAQPALSLQQCRDSAVVVNLFAEQYENLDAITRAKESLLRKIVTPDAALFGLFTYQSDTPDPNSALEVGFDFRPISNDQYRSGLVVKQQIFTGGEYKSRRELLSNERDIAENRIVNRRIEMENNVDELYLSIVLASRSVEILKHQFNELEIAAEKLQNFFNEGKVFKVEVIKAETALLETEQRIASIKAEEQKLRAMLSVITGIKISAADLFVIPGNELIHQKVTDPAFDEFMLLEQGLSISERISKSQAMPKAYIFGVGGYAKPALDIFLNRPDIYGIAGLSVKVPLTAWRDHKRFKSIVSLQKRELEISQNLYSIRRDYLITRNIEDVKKFEGLIERDNLLIEKYSLISEQTQKMIDAGEAGASDLLIALSQESRAKISREYNNIERIKSIIKSNRVLAGTK